MLLTELAFFFLSCSLFSLSIINPLTLPSKAIFPSFWLLCVHEIIYNSLHPHHLADFMFLISETE